MKGINQCRLKLNRGSIQLITGAPARSIETFENWYRRTQANTRTDRSTFNPVIRRLLLNTDTKRHLEKLIRA